MDTSLRSRLSQIWFAVQNALFPEIEAQMGQALTPKLEQLIRILELARVEEHVASSWGAVGRPPRDRAALARAFVAKAVFDLPTTEALIDRLSNDTSLKRLCGFALNKKLPDAATFSRAFDEFASTGLPGRVHAAMIDSHLGEQIVGHLNRDSTEIEARERPADKPAPAPKPAKRRGRPKKGESRPKEPTRIERQLQMNALSEMIADLPRACDVGTKRDSQGHQHSWVGYKLHWDVADGCIPIAALLTSASVHDSQAFIPLAKISAERVTSLYDVADSAYCSPLLRQFSRELDHVPLIDHNPRSGEKIAFAPHEAERFKERSTVERANARLKDEFGARHVRVRGATKVMAHLMFGVLALTADQLLRWVT
jgi:hypothetical protein